MPDLIEAARQVMSSAKKFLIVGQRWDLDVTQPLDFSGDWVTRLRDETRAHGELHRPMGSDYLRLSARLLCRYA